MRQLRLVTLADDGGHLMVETADGNERFGLPVDLALREAVAGRPTPGDAPAGPARPATTTATAMPSAAPTAFGVVAPPSPGRGLVGIAEIGPAPIGPRDIQVRVRGGESPQHLADTYGMSLERIMRFAAPVVEERARISGEARRSRARRNTTDGQVVVFGEAVDERFAAHGIAADSVEWDAHRRRDGEWVVIARWAGGTGSPSAEWLFSRTSRSVAPLDDAAVDLLSDRPIRPVPPAELPAPERPSLAAAPPLRQGVVAFPPMPDAHTGPLPRVEEVFDQDAPLEGPRAVPPLVPAAAASTATPSNSSPATGSPATSSPAAAGSPATGSPAALASIRFDASPLDFEEPPLPLGIADPSTRPGGMPSAGALRTLGAGRRTESGEDRAARVRVPSWDDILLGVRRTTD